MKSLLHSYKENKWFYICSFPLLFIISFVYYKKSIDLLWFIPYGLLGIYLLVFQVRLFYLAMVVSIPFSLNIESGAESFGLSLPAEPMMVAMMGLFFLKEIHSRVLEKDYWRHPVTVLIVLQTIWLAITCCTSSMPMISFKFLVARLWLLTSGYFISLYFFQNINTIRKTLVAYVIPLCITIIYIVLAHYKEGFSKQVVYYITNPFFKDHTIYGAVLGLYVSIVGYLVYSAKGLFWKSTYVLCSIILLAGLFFSYTRAAWLSVMLMMAFYSLYYFRIKFLYFVIFITTFTTIVYEFQDWIAYQLKSNQTSSSNGSVKEHVKSIYNVKTDVSNLERLNRWNSALRMYEAKPFLGFGPGTYVFQYGVYQAQKDKTVISTNRGTVGGAHSEYMQPLAESGLVGLLLTLALFITVIYRASMVYSKRLLEPNLQALLIALLMGLLTYFLHGLVNNYLDTDKAAYPFWSFIAAIVALDVYAKSPANTYSTNEF